MKNTTDIKRLDELGLRLAIHSGNKVYDILEWRPHDECTFEWTYTDKLARMSQVNNGGEETMHRIANYLRDMANAIDSEADVIGWKLDMEAEEL